MAIQKTKTLPNGSVGNYWRIMDIHINRQGLRAMGRIALFKDAATSAAGAPPLGCVKEFRFSFTLAELAATPNLVAFVYLKIVAAAEALITHDLAGNLLETPRPSDPDLAGGETV